MEWDYYKGDVVLYTEYTHIPTPSPQFATPQEEVGAEERGGDGNCLLLMEEVSLFSSLPPSSPFPYSV